MGPTIPSRHAKSSRVTYNDVGTPFARGLEHRQCEQVSRTYDERLRVVHRLRERAEILDVAVYIGILDEYTAQIGA